MWKPDFCFAIQDWMSDSAKDVFLMCIYIVYHAKTFPALWCFRVSLAPTMD